MNILATIKASAELRKLADAGQDAQVADSIAATLQQPQPITVAALTQAAPQTLATIASGTNPLAEIDVIASRVRAGDWLGVGAWADTLLMLGKMTAGEHTAVEVLVAAATVNESITHEQVSAALNAIRPHAAAADGGGARALPINWDAI
jgi:hypothetical protein